MTTAPTTATPNAAHSLLGRPSRVVLHRYRPDRIQALTAPDEVAACVAAVGTEHADSATVPRSMPSAEVAFLDASGGALGTVVFLADDDLGMVSTVAGGTWVLSPAEAVALRALLAQHLP